MGRRNKHPDKPFVQLRKAHGLTQDEMAEKLGVSCSTIQSIEVGRLEISRKMAKRLADTFGVDERGFVVRWKPCPHCGGMGIVEE